MTGTIPLRQGHILITGGAGFLGTNMADALARRGNEVLVFDNLSREHVRENLAWLKACHPTRVGAVIADIRDAEALSQAVRGARAVIHLAAQVAVTTAIEDPLTDFEVNARGTLNVLEAVRRGAPGAAVLFASTNKVYGKLQGDEAFVCAGSRYQPRDAALARGFDEKTPLSLYSPYGCSKGAADQYVLDYARIYGLKTAVLRMSCLYGPHQFGTEDQGWVAHFLIRARKGQTIDIYGDGYQVRDALYVDDAVDAYLTCLTQIDAVCGRAFNLGGGPENCLSLVELLDRMEEMDARRPTVRLHDWRPGDQLWYVSDTRALSAATGWHAQVPLGQGLVRLNSWITERFDGAREAVA